MIYRFIYFPLIHRALYCFPQYTPRRSTVTLTACGLAVKTAKVKISFVIKISYQSYQINSSSDVHLFLGITENAKGRCAGEISNLRSN